MPTSLLNDHHAIIVAANKLLALLRRQPRPAMDEVSQLRAHIGALMLRHMRNEETLVIGPLLASGRIGDLPGGAGVLAEMRELNALYSRHIGDWTLQAIKADWSGYVDAVSHVTGRMQVMFAHEEKYLHEPVLQLLSLTAATSPVTQASTDAR